MKVDFKSMKEKMKPEDKVKEQLYQKIEHNQRSTVIKRPWLPMVAAMCVLIVATVLIYPIVSRDGAPWNQGGTHDIRLFDDDEKMFRAYAQYRYAIWSEILTELEQGDYTAWLLWEEYLSCVQNQSVPPIEVARQQVEFWSDWEYVGNDEAEEWEKWGVRTDFGVYNGNRILTLGSSFSRLQWGFNDVAGYRLAYDCCHNILVYTGEEFYDIRQAYDLGVLRKQDITALYNKHFKDCEWSFAPGERTPEVPEAGNENFRELQWVTTPDGNQLNIRYNVNYFAHLGLTEDEIREETIKIADVMVKYIMSVEVSDIIMVNLISISRLCWRENVTPDNINDFFVEAGVYNRSGSSSMLDRVTVSRLADGNYELQDNYLRETIEQTAYYQKLMKYMWRFSASKQCLETGVDVHDHVYWSDDITHFQEFVNFFLSLDLMKYGGFQASMTGYEEMWTAMGWNEDDSNNLVIWVMKNMTNNFTDVPYNHISLFGMEVSADYALSAKLTDEQYEWFENWAQIFEDNR
jgi:hypothetical protein